MRYVYATYSNRDRAEDALEDCFANSEVSEAERPRIEPKRDHRGRVVAWQITLRHE